MTRKALVLAAMSLACTSATQSDIPATAHPEVVKVECLTGAGSAFRVGRHTLISAKHVTSLKGCFIDGKPFKVWDGPTDYSIITTDYDAPKYLKIDCDGFVANRKYTAIGYARAWDTLTTVDLRAVGSSMEAFSILTGMWTVIPGQSGGPIIDPTTGRVVGLVNIYNFQAGMSGSIPMKDTEICNS